MARRGQGSYGAVYRAVRVGREAEGPVALKLALSSNDARFAREVELLSRVRHPAVPRFVDSGHSHLPPPEAWQPLPPSAPGPRHSPGPADDVLALGVIAYQVVVGRYPPSTHPADEASFVWHHSRTGPHAPRAFNERCCEELSALVLRMLSVRPEARGSARELAEALEDAALRAGPEADKLLWAQAAPWLAQGRAATEPVPVPPPPVPPAPSRSWHSWPLALAVGLALVLGDGSGQLMSSEAGGARLVEPTALLTKDGGRSSVADTAHEASGDATPAPPSSRRIAREVPPMPLPSQAVPDVNGRCPGRMEVSIHGCCWLRLHVEDIENCDGERYFEHQGACYPPILLPIPPQPYTRRGRCVLDMKAYERRTRSTWRLAGFLLVLLAALGAQAEPPSSKLPGRQRDSKEPWGAFLGRAAHEAIGREYSVRHPLNVVFLNTFSLYTIVKDAELGNPKRLSEFVRLLRPDITDTDALVLFEIKPDDEESRMEGREQAGRYLAALNAVVEPDRRLVGGTGFEGSLFLEFENGGALWRLSWRTPEPGVTLYRWSYRRKKPNASWKERAAQKEEELPRQEIEQRGELAEQAIRAAYGRGERPNGFEGQVYLPVDCR